MCLNPKIHPTKIFSVPVTFPKDVKCESNTEKFTSLEISWIKLTVTEARGKILHYNVYYQNVNELKLNDSKYKK